MSRAMTSAVCTSARDPHARIQKLSVVPSAFARRSFGNIERNTVRRSTKLVGKSLLLEVGKTLRRSRALNRESLRMLPRLQCVMVRHSRRITRTQLYTASFHFIPYPVYSIPRCVCSLAFACPRLWVLGRSDPAHQLLHRRPLACHQNPH